MPSQPNLMNVTAGERAMALNGRDRRAVARDAAHRRAAIAGITLPVYIQNSATSSGGLHVYPPRLYQDHCTRWHEFGFIQRERGHCLGIFTKSITKKVHLAAARLGSERNSRGERQQDRVPGCRLLSTCRRSISATDAS